MLTALSVFVWFIVVLVIVVVGGSALFSAWVVVDEYIRERREHAQAQRDASVADQPRGAGPGDPGGTRGE